MGKGGKGRGGGGESQRERVSNCRATMLKQKIENSKLGDSVT